MLKADKLRFERLRSPDEAVRVAAMDGDGAAAHYARKLLAKYP